jgi:hypothetical protein
MQTYNVTEGDGKLIVHMEGDNSNYEVSYDHGKLIFSKGDRQYIIPEKNADDLFFKRPDPNTSARKYDFVNYRNTYRDTIPTDFGINNIENKEPGTTHQTNEIVLGGVNDKVPVIAPQGVTIYVNGNVVSSGYLVDNGDVIKFELTASDLMASTINYNVSVGDITKSFSVSTIAVMNSCLDFKNAGFDTDGYYQINPSNPTQVYCDMTTDGGGWTLAKRISVDSSSSDWFKNHPNAPAAVTGKGATKVMWKGFNNTTNKSINGQQPTWAIVTYPTGGYQVDNLYAMTERGTTWRISSAYRNASMDFYSVIGNVSCSYQTHVHVDHGYTGYKAEIASFYGCSWNGQSSYDGYLLYYYSTHNNNGYFARTYENGSYTGRTEIMAYEIFYR